MTHESNSSAKGWVIAKQIAKAPYTYLFINMLVLFALLPLEEKIHETFPVTQVLFASLVILVLRAIQASWKEVLVFGILSVFSLTDDFLWAGVSSGLGVRLTAALIDAALVFTVILILLKKLFSETRVSADTIFGGITVYFLFGLFWMILYRAISVVNPGSISLSEDLGQAGQLLYFSFITMMTVGYGDLVPRTPLARNLAILEAFTGQLYLAILSAAWLGFTYPVLELVMIQLDSLGGVSCLSVF